MVSQRRPWSTSLPVSLARCMDNGIWTHGSISTRFTIFRFHHFQCKRKIVICLDPGIKLCLWGDRRGCKCSHSHTLRGACWIIRHFAERCGRIAPTGAIYCECCMTQSARDPAKRRNCVCDVTANVNRNHFLSLSWSLVQAKDSGLS